MEKKPIRIMYQRKVNLGNYESAAFGLEVDVDLPVEFAEAHVMGLVEGWIERFKVDRNYFKRMLMEMEMNVKNNKA